MPLYTLTITTTKQTIYAQFFRNDIRNERQLYFYQFLACEILNVLTVLATFLCTNKFLNGRWIFYGPEVVSYYRMTETRLNNPMCDVFPRIASCSYYRLL